MRSVPVGRDLINNRNLCVCVFVCGGCVCVRGGASLSPLLLRCSREGPIKGASASRTATWPTRMRSRTCYGPPFRPLLEPTEEPVAAAPILTPVPLCCLGRRAPDGCDGCTGANRAALFEADTTSPARALLLPSQSDPRSITIRRTKQDEKCSALESELVLVTHVGTASKSVLTQSIKVKIN